MAFSGHQQASAALGDIHLQLLVIRRGVGCERRSRGRELRAAATAFPHVLTALSASALRTLISQRAGTRTRRETSGRGVDIRRQGIAVVEVEIRFGVSRVRRSKRGRRGCGEGRRSDLQKEGRRADLREACLVLGPAAAAASANLRIHCGLLFCRFLSLRA